MKDASKMDKLILDIPRTIQKWLNGVGTEVQREKNIIGFA